MAANSKIEWTDHTFNPWIGCTKVSPGCDHCYAERREDQRLHRVRWGAGQPRQRTKTWGDPVRWNKQHEAFFAEHGRRQRVFCASLADAFDNEVDPAWRDELMGLIASTPNLDWLLLTKRIGNVAKMLKASAWEHLPHVWLGATVVNQEEADRDVRKLLALPARVRFLSIEPMLGPIDLTRIELHKGPLAVAPEAPPEWQGVREVAVVMNALKGSKQLGMAPLSWVIAGGESGPGARPMHPDWARSLRDQCAAAGVPFLFKQWGEHTPGELADNPAYPGDDSAWRLDQRGERWHEPMEGLKPRADWAPMRFLKVGKKAAGRQLDGRTHDGFPEAN